MVQLSHPYMTTGKTIALIRWIFVSKVMSLLFNMTSRFVIAFLPRSKRLLISWLQSLSVVILEPKKIKSVTVLTVSLNTVLVPWSELRSRRNGNEEGDRDFLLVSLLGVQQRVSKGDPVGTKWFLNPCFSHWVCSPISAHYTSAPSPFPQKSRLASFQPLIGMFCLDSTFSLFTILCAEMT